MYWTDILNLAGMSLACSPGFLSLNVRSFPVLVIIAVQLGPLFSSPGSFTVLNIHRPQ